MEEKSVLLKKFFSKKEFLRFVKWMQKRPTFYPLSEECREEMRRQIRFWIQKQMKVGKKKQAKPRKTPSSF